MNEESDTVHAAAQTFLTRMSEFDDRSRASYSARGAVREALCSELKGIFREHLTHKAASRKQRRYVDLYDTSLFKNAGEFLCQIMRVEPAGSGAESGAYWAVAEHWVLGFTRFHFVKHDDIWKIDYREVGIGIGIGIDGVKWQRKTDI